MTRICKDFPTGAVGTLDRLDVYEAPSGAFTGRAMWYTATSTTATTYALTAPTLADARHEALRALDADATHATDETGAHVEFMLPRGSWDPVGRPENERHALHGTRVASWRP